MFQMNAWRGGNNRLKVVIARYTAPHPEGCDQELSDGVSEDSDEEVHDSIVMDLEDEAYDNHDCEHIDPLLPDQIIY